MDEGRRRYQHLRQRCAQTRFIAQRRTVSSLATLRVAKIRGDRDVVFRGHRTAISHTADQTGNARLADAAYEIGGACIDH